jgi:hypothetical protein
VESEVRGVDLSEAKRLKGLEDESRRLKKLLAEARLDNAARSRTRWEKTSEACGAADRGHAIGRAVLGQPGSRLHAGGTQPLEIPFAEAPLV